jgi:predicted nuclease with TOPRIM domain
MSANEKPTLEMNQLEIIRRLIEKSESKLDNVSSKVDLLDTRFRTLEATAEGTRHEVQRLNGRVTDLEGDVRHLRDQDSTIKRQTSETDLAHEAALGSAIAHVSKLEKVMKDQGEVLTGLVQSQNKQTETLALVSTVLTNASAAVARNVLYFKAGLVIAGVLVGIAVAIWKTFHS